MLKRCYLRVTAAALCSGVIAGFLVACSPIFLPSRPTFIQPISLTVVNDQIAWVQCLADEILVDEIAISLEEGAGAKRDLILYVAEGDSATDAVPAPAATPMLPSSFPSLPVYDKHEVRASDLSGRVDIFLIVSGPEMRAEMAFKDLDLQDLREGQYVYHSGEVSSDPCGMKAAK